MSRKTEFSSAISKRAMEAALREAGLSIRDSKTAISVFCRFLDQGLETDRDSTLGKIFTRLKRGFNAA